ncbi:copy number control protein [Fischerella sp. PCC 9605]|uniref:copy number control protein n=1 Tax=Fischerella sp. PCC 9605 TaxID=1173024 RepID=UPI001E4F8B3D|nr:copy number control protein [Fischerella sp. PCC 9605]
MSPRPKKDEGTVEMRVFVPGDLRNQFKGKCATQGKTMSEIITAFMHKYVSGQINLTELEEGEK